MTKKKAPQKATQTPSVEGRLAEKDQQIAELQAALAAAGPPELEPAPPRELSGEIVEFDLHVVLESGDLQDGDRCEIKVFDSSKGRTSDGPISIFDGSRGVFFKCPVHGGGGSIVGPRRDNYKAERVRDVVAFKVIEANADPKPEQLGVLDTARMAQAVSARPAPIKTPARVTAGDELAES